MGGIADDAALADRIAPSLELRLHQRDEPGPGCGEAERRRERLGQADEADIGDDGPDLLADQRSVEGPRIGPLQRDDAGVASQLRMELTSADIYGVDFRGATEEQNLREPPSRGAKVERHPSLRLEAEGIQRGFELERAPRD